MECSPPPRAASPAPIRLDPSLTQSIAQEIRRLGMAEETRGEVLHALLGLLFADRPEFRAVDVNLRLAVALLQVDGDRAWETIRRSAGRRGAHPIS